MRKIYLSLAAIAFVAAASGCANMPDLKGLPMDKLGLPVGTGGSSSSTIDSALSAGKNLADASKQFTEQEEIALGEDLMATILGAAPLYKDERIQRYVNRVGRWVASHSERPNLPWRFAVLDTPLVNAGAAPGGQIYISTGLLLRMRSEAELAGALAHEIAHVVKKHQLTAYSKRKLGSAFAASGSAVVDAKLQGGTLAKEGAKFAIGELQTMVVLKLDRSEEEQADRMGMILTARAGYDPYGLPTVLQILQDLSAEQSGSSLIYSTHPSAADRIAYLDRAFGKTLESYGSQATLRDRFNANILGTSTPVASSPAPVAKPVAKPSTKPATK
jgi:beta-barrel assembly-enhancing protease